MSISIELGRVCLQGSLEVFLMDRIGKSQSMWLLSGAKLWVLLTSGAVVLFSHWRRSSGY